MRDVRRMPWGQLILTLQAKSQSYGKETSIRQATQKEIDNWF